MSCIGAEPKLGRGRWRRRAAWQSWPASRRSTPRNYRRCSPQKNGDKLPQQGAPTSRRKWRWRKIIVADQVVSTYALWEDINEVLRPLLARHGFVLSFRTGQEGDAVVVTAVLDHRDGHQEATSLRLPPDVGVDRNSVQAVGSSVSYGKRYTACALLTITTRGEDDDARAAQGLITPEQVKHLEQHLTALNTTPKRLLRYMKVESLALIPSSRFREAISVLKAKSQGLEGVR